MCTPVADKFRAVLTKLLFFQRKPIELYEADNRLPQVGERVDSINYFTRYLAILNEEVSILQTHKLDLALRGEDTRRASEWISQTLGLGSQRSSAAPVVRKEISQRNHVPPEMSLT